jgi:hypothetical protein
MGPIPPCVGLIPLKLSVEGFLLIIKPSFCSFFCFPFLPCYLAGVMGKTEKMVGGGVFPKNKMECLLLLWKKIQKKRKNF